MTDHIAAFLASLAGRVSGGTVSCYACDLAQISQFCRPVDVAGVDRALVGDWLANFKANATRQRKFAALRGFFAFLRAAGVITRDPVIEMMISRERPCDRRLVSRDEMRRLIEAVPVGGRDRVALELLGMGLLVSEVCALKRSEVHLDRGVLSFKGAVREGARRLVELESDVVDAIALYLSHTYPFLHRRDGVENLLVNHAGRPMHRQSLWSICTSASASVGLGSVSPLDLRWSRGIHMITVGMGDGYVQGQLGHAFPGTTTRYVKAARKAHLAGRDA